MTDTHSEPTDHELDELRVAYYETGAFYELDFDEFIESARESLTTTRGAA